MSVFVWKWWQFFSFKMWYFLRLSFQIYWFFLVLVMPSDYNFFKINYQTHPGGCIRKTFEGRHIDFRNLREKLCLGVPKLRQNKFHRFSDFQMFQKWPISLYNLWPTLEGVLGNPPPSSWVGTKKFFVRGSGCSGGFRVRGIQKSTSRVVKVESKGRIR